MKDIKFYFTQWKHREWLWLATAIIINHFLNIIQISVTVSIGNETF